MKTITYKELADRLDAVKLFNKAPELDPEIYDKLENGSLYDDTPCHWFLNDSKPERRWCCDTHQYEGDATETEEHFKPEPGDYCGFAEQEPTEVYQWYLISPTDAEYLKNNTDELIFYSDVLDEYVWGVTHFGTPWEGVSLDFGKECQFEKIGEQFHCVTHDDTIEPSDNMAVPLTCDIADGINFDD